MYIHNLPDWPRLSFDKKALSLALVETTQRQATLLGQMQALGFQARGDAQLSAVTANVVDTSAIEGEVLNTDQVRSSIARRLGIQTGALVASDRKVDGVVEMTLEATQHYADPLTEQRLFRWQQRLFDGHEMHFRKIAIGRFRDDALGPMQVVSGPIGREKVHFEAPAAHRVSAEMTVFMDWFNQQCDYPLILKSGIAHLWFVTIHPFDDGNGRIARTLSDLLLARSEQSAERYYSLSSQILVERRAYYEQLESAQKGSLDITAWLSWYVGCLNRAFDRSAKLLKSIKFKTQFWATHPPEQYNARQIKLLNRLMEGFEGFITTSKYARLTKCSQDTAGRDINELLATNILTKNSKGGRSSSYAMAGLADALLE